MQPIALFVIIAVITVVIGLVVQEQPLTKGKEKEKKEEEEVEGVIGTRQIMSPLAHSSVVSITQEPKSIFKDKTKDLDISTWHSSWRFPTADHGCCTFRVIKPGGLVIALSTQFGRTRWYEGHGYALVVDDQNQDRPKSWVGKLPIFTREMPGSKINWGYKMPVPPVCEDYWLVVDHGYIWLGTGEVPGRNLILAAQDPSPIQGIQYVGFGSWGKNIGWGCEDNRVRRELGSVQLVRVWDPPPKMPMPVEYGSCPTGAAYNCQRITSTLLNMDIEKYFPRDY